MRWRLSDKPNGNAIIAFDQKGFLGKFTININCIFSFGIVNIICCFIKFLLYLYVRIGTSYQYPY